MKIVLVLEPSPDCWRERLLGTSTKTGRKVLKCIAYKITLEIMWVIRVEISFKKLQYDQKLCTNVLLALFRMFLNSIAKFLSDLKL
jgi:hypothetical protein